MQCDCACVRQAHFLRAAVSGWQLDEDKGRRLPAALQPPLPHACAAQELDKSCPGQMQLALSHMRLILRHGWRWACCSS